MKPPFPLQVRILDPRVGDPRLGAEIPLPEYQTDGAAAMDLRAALDRPLELQPGAVAKVPTGIAIHVRDPQLAALIIPRSGIATRDGIVLANSVGLIDSDYQGPLTISCLNRSDAPRTLQVGERVAQLMLVPVRLFGWDIVDAFAPSGRGEGGFGSTGSR